LVDSDEDLVSSNYCVLLKGVKRVLKLHKLCDAEMWDMWPDLSGPFMGHLPFFHDVLLLCMSWLIMK
ncbi:hypothetical protein CEXT_188071, partial [Caerostris extrusa]